MPGLFQVSQARRTARPLAEAAGSPQHVSSIRVRNVAPVLANEAELRTVPRMVKKLLHTRMRVNDLERTVKFYQDALGLGVSSRHTSPRGAQLAFLSVPNSEEEIEICLLPNSPSVQVQPDLMHLAFEVEDLNAFAAELKKKGYPLTDGPTVTGSGAIIAFIDAPEGYEVELIQLPKK